MAIERLRAFVHDFAALLDHTTDEARILEGGAILLHDLVGRDDWLPDAFAVPASERYQQYLLHCDSLERFSVVSFVWGPGQSTPIHNHTVWGLIGMLRGAEIGERFELRDGKLLRGPTARLAPGNVDVVSPTVGDIHRVNNAHNDRVSISIHVYGANIAAVERAIIDETGQPTPFVSGYASAMLPNLWDRSDSRH